MVELQPQGLDQGIIARTIGVSPRTVSRWSAVGQFPERKRRTGDASGLVPYRSYLLERWQAGCRDMTHLWREVQSQGFLGSYGLVYDYLAPLRCGEPVRPAAWQAPVPEAGATPPVSYTARQLSFLLLRRVEELTVMEQHDLAPSKKRTGMETPCIA